MSASIVSGRGGGPSAIGVTVAQPLRISRRPLRPPGINRLIAFAAFRLNDGIPVTVFVLGAVLQPPEHHCGQRAEEREGTGNHFPSPYLREMLEMKSTIFCSVFSGSSPGITVATAMAAVSTAVRTPRYDCQLFATFWTISIPRREMSKDGYRPSLRDTTVPKAEAAAVTITQASQSLVFRE